MKLWVLFLICIKILYYSGKTYFKLKGFWDLEYRLSLHLNYLRQTYISWSIGVILQEINDVMCSN